MLVALIKAAHKIKNHRVDIDLDRAVAYCDDADEIPSCIREPRRWPNASDGKAAGTSNI